MYKIWRPWRSFKSEEDEVKDALVVRRFSSSGSLKDVKLKATNISLETSPPLSQKSSKKSRAPLPPPKVAPPPPPVPLTSPQLVSSSSSSSMPRPTVTPPPSPKLECPPTPPRSAPPVNPKLSVVKILNMSGDESDSDESTDTSDEDDKGNGGSLTVNGINENESIRAPTPPPRKSSLMADDQSSFTVNNGASMEEIQAVDSLMHLKQNVINFAW